ncbi:MAG: VOC family protein, partial [Candidatus Nanopelagicales bacterium]
AIPGPPVMDEQTKSLVERLMSQGFATGLFFTTDDAHAAYASLVANGVEVTGEPTEQPYGIDFGFRDPSGNSYRVSQRIPMG